MYHFCQGSRFRIVILRLISKTKYTVTNWHTFGISQTSTEHHGVLIPRFVQESRLVWGPDIRIIDNEY